MDSPGARLLRSYVDVRFGQRVLTLGIAPELAADWAAQAATGQVWAVSDDLAEVQEMQRLAQAEHLSALHPLHAADLSALAALTFEACAVDILGYLQRDYLHHMLWEGVQRLEPNGAGARATNGSESAEAQPRQAPAARGALWIVGPNDGGIHSLEKRLRETWGEVNVLGYKKGHRILQIPRPAEPTPLEEATPEQQRLTLRGEKFSLALRPGVFAGGDLDPATRLLANELEIENSETILDLGCGSGILGMLAARLAPQSQVYLVDASAVALATAEKNCRQNNLTNTHVLASDSVAAVQNQCFDLVLCNPPFHEQGAHSNTTALRFIREVSGILAPRGRFLVVANQFLRYEPALRESFGSVTTLAQDRKYKVLQVESAARL